MPYEDAKTYRINPFDLTKIWPHSDYPLIKVGTMTLNRNPDNFFAQIEQAAFEPSALVPGIGFSPDKMLLGRAFAYSDTHRYRIGPNYLQLPVNRPRVDGQHLHVRRPDGLRAQRRRPGLRPQQPRARLRRRDRPGRGRLGGRRRDGAQAYTLHAEDDDFGQAGTLVREVWNDEQREPLRRHRRRATCSAACSGDVLERAFEYWKNVDADTGKRIEEKVRAGVGGTNPGGEPEMAKVDHANPVVETNTNAG